MFKLVVKFLNSVGKTHTWTYDNPNTNKTPGEIQALLEKMTTLNLFEKDGVKMFQQVVSAKFVQIIETPLFNLNNVPNESVALAIPVPMEREVQPESAFTPTNEVVLDQAGSAPVKDVESVAAADSVEETIDDSAYDLPLPSKTDRTSEVEAESIPVNTKIPQQERIERVLQFHEKNKKKKKRKKRK